MLKKLFDKFGRHDEKGHEHLDPTPVAIPAHLKAPLTLQEQMLRLIRSENFRRNMAASGRETFEEADDFDVEDEFEDPFTRDAPYEENFDQVKNWEEAKAQTKENMRAKPPRQPKAGKFVEEEPVEKAPPKKKGEPKSVSDDE